MITMLLGGLWHGASWVFVFWGFLHGMYLVVQRLIEKPTAKLMNALKLPTMLQTAMSIGVVYFFTCFAWIFFRAPNFEVASTIITRIASLEGFHVSTIISKFMALKGAILITILLAIEFTNLRIHYVPLLVRNPVFRLAAFALILWTIAFFGTFGANAFIYFQF